MSANGRPRRGGTALRNLSHLSRALGLTWQASRGWTIAWIVLVVLQGVLPAATVLLTKYLVDAVAAVIGAGLTPENISAVLFPAILMGAALLLGQLFGNLLTWVRTAQSEHVTDRVKSMIHEQATAMDLAFYETPDLLDQLLRATSEAGTRSLSILQNTGTLLQHTITLVGISAILITYSIWLPVVLLVGTVPALAVVVRHNRLYHAWWEETTEKRRWERYFDLALTSAYSAPEIRTLRLSPLLRQRHDTLRRELRERRLGLLRRQTIAQFFAGFVGLIVTAATMVWMGVRAMRGAATIGDLALFYQAFSQGQGLMRSLLSGAGQLYADALFMEHLFSLLALRPEITSPDKPQMLTGVSGGDARARRVESRNVVFEGVTFTYPSADQPALSGFDLEIPAGKTVAVVGPNGVGKSTLIKLLCRLYDPQQGRVLIDGQDIRSLGVDALRDELSVMFQFPVQWFATARENIIYGDLDAAHDDERIRAAADAAGATTVVERLAKGYDTLLSKQFKGGTELSGGQWQRIALARAFYRDAPIVVLDEPTSFMDSWEEARWLERFRALVRERTALIVTHRFSTAMHADLIYVMDEGKVVESGSHEALVELDGFYASSWKQQQAPQPPLPTDSDTRPRE